MTRPDNIREEHRLPHGFVGYLDTPAPDYVFGGETCTVRGWAVGGARQIERVFVRGKRGLVIDATAHLPRPDVAGAYPQLADSDRSGFEAHVDLRQMKPGAHGLDVCAVDDAGRTTVLFTRRIVVDHPESPSLIQTLRAIIGKALTAFREGRLTLSPRQWVADLRKLVDDLHPHRAGGTGQGTSRPTDIKGVLTTLYLAQLRLFLDSGARLAFPAESAPQVSIVLVLFNRAELTLRCLRSLLEPTTVRFEVIIVDNASSDQTPGLLAQLDNVTILPQVDNVGFLHGVNSGAAVARGTHLLLLNNDTEVLPGTLEAALACLEHDDGIGAVGARLVLPDGTLQEAGSIIWNDGSCVGYGRGASPDAPEFQFRRDVDYCSGAFLLTPRVLFEELGGLDVDYQPAYYEEVDYCVRLLKRGLRIVYEPRALVSHFEFASSRSVDAVRMQVERRGTFVAKHAEWLERQPSPSATPQVQARARLSTTAQRILYVDDRVPFDNLGAGYPRARLMAHALVRDGHATTLYPMTTLRDEWKRVYEALPAEVEVMLNHGPDQFRAFMDERQGFYDCMIVSRPHNLRTLRSLYPPHEWPPVPLIYDAEALFSLREVEFRRMTGDSMSADEVRRRVDDELALAQGASLVTCVSTIEASFFTRAGHDTTTLGHAVVCAPTKQPFATRQGFLFVGALNDRATPNSDSVVWFAREVLPKIQEQIGPVTFTIVGDRPPPEVLDLADTCVKVVGRVDDLDRFFKAARVFVAPTRFASGIPLKMLHAAALGVPGVCTTILQQQLAWTDGVELLAADSPEDFANACSLIYREEQLWTTVRNGALARVGADHAIGQFEASMRSAITKVTAGNAGPSASQNMPRQSATYGEPRAS